MYARISIAILVMVADAGGCSNTNGDAAAPAAASEQEHVAGGFASPSVQDAPSRESVSAAGEPGTVVPPPAPPPEAAAKPRASALEFAFVGDVIFGRYRESGFDAIPEDGYDVFGEIADVLSADVLVGNLETPLVRELPLTSPIGSRFRFGASPEHAQHLVRAGFTAVSLANNHWYDMRIEGVEQTPAILEELGVVPLGAATRDEKVFRVQTIERDGWTIGFLALTARSNAPQRDDVPTLPFLNTGDIPELITPVLEDAKAAHDVLIVQIHWGEEYEDGPNATQRRAAHAMVDAGANLVIGHHPHVLQGTEAYGNGLIAYSLGNFLFENTNDPPRLTGVLKIRLSSDGCRESVRFHPAYIKRMPHPHPVPASGYMGRLVRDRVLLVNRRFGTAWTEDSALLRMEDANCVDGVVSQPEATESRK